jgi:hypothetical protein
MVDFCVAIKYKMLLFNFQEHERWVAVYVTKCNLQDSFVLPVMWYLAMAHGLQVALI